MEGKKVEGQVGRDTFTKETIIVVKKQPDFQVLKMPDANRP